MAGTSWPSLIAGARARASDVESKFDWLEGNLVPMNSGTSADATYDIGTSAARWRNGYFSGGIVSGGAVSTSPSAVFEAIGEVHLRTVSETTTSALFLRFVAAAQGVAPANGNSLGGIRAVITQADPGTLKSKLEMRVNIGDNEGAIATFYPSGCALELGATVNEFSIDGSMAGNSDIAVPTEKAVKTYVDATLNAALGMRVKAYLSATTTVAIGGSTITSMTEIVDVASEFSSGAFTAATDGTYEIILTSWQFLDATTTAQGNQRLFITLAGSVTTEMYSEPLTGDGSVHHVNVHEILSITAGQVVRFTASGRSYLSGAAGGFNGKLYIKKIG